MALNRIQKAMLEQIVQDELNRIGNTSSLTTTNKTNLVSAVNENKSSIGTVDSKVGNITTLTTVAKTSTVVALNELDGEIGALSSLTTTDKSTLVNAINELDSVKLEGLLTDANIANNAAIKASKLAIQKLYKKSTVANPSTTLDTYGTVVDLLPTTGYTSLIPLGIDIVFGGTFGVETVTADITVTFSDATTATISKTATAIGTVSLSNSDIMALAKDGVYINKLSVKSKSSIATSTTSVTTNHYGFYL
ncbi:hypothetical protein D3C84_551420 [compost metagenome]